MRHAALDRLPALIAAQDWPAAERLLRRAAKDRDAPAAVFYNLAKVLEHAGKPAQCRTWLKRAVAVDPRHGDAWFELGRAAIAAGDLTEALTAFRHAARLAPEDADAWRNLGQVALRLGDWQTARTAWGRLGCSPEADPEAVAGLYRAEAELGLTNLARAAALIADRPGPQSLKALTGTAKGHLPFRLTAR